MAEPRPIPDPNHDRQVREVDPPAPSPAGQPSDTTAREPVPDPWRLPLTVPVRERDDAPGGAE